MRTHTSSGYCRFMNSDQSQNELAETYSDLDLPLLIRNLSLSFEERLIEHQRALDLLMELSKAGLQFYAKSK